MVRGVRLGGEGQGVDEMMSEKSAIECLDVAIDNILKADGLLTGFCNQFDLGPDPVIQSNKLREVVRWAHAERERLNEKQK